MGPNGLDSIHALWEHLEMSLISWKKTNVHIAQKDTTAVHQVLHSQLRNVMQATTALKVQVYQLPMIL